MNAADFHKKALNEWKRIAGDVQVDWALDHREEVEAAAHVRRDISALSALSSTAPEMSDNRATDLARVLVTRLSEVRSFGQNGESYPLILDDPFVELDPGIKPSLLELLGHNVLSPQVIFLTEDEDVASWARLEALTGALSIIEPTPATAEKQADPFVVAL
jgi:hypothetical protein